VLQLYTLASESAPFGSPDFVQAIGWFGEGPELSVLRMLGLFDRPVDEKVIDVLLTQPAIPDLTES
jgi:hypothetical protein